LIASGFAATGAMPHEDRTLRFLFEAANAYALLAPATSRSMMLHLRHCSAIARVPLHATVENRFCSRCSQVYVQGKNCNVKVEGPRRKRRCRSKQKTALNKAKPEKDDVFFEDVHPIKLASNSRPTKNVGKPQHECPPRKPQVARRPDPNRPQVANRKVCHVCKVCRFEQRFKVVSSRPSYAQQKSRKKFPKHATAKVGRSHDSKERGQKKIGETTSGAATAGELKLPKKQAAALGSGCPLQVSHGEAGKPALDVSPQVLVDAVQTTTDAKLAVKVRQGHGIGSIAAKPPVVANTPAPVGKRRRKHVDKMSKHLGFSWDGRVSVGTDGNNLSSF